MMERRQDWPARLADAIEAASGRPFSWGQHDCCAAACALIEAMTDANPMADLPAYDDEAGARAVIEPYGGVVEIVEALSDDNGFPEIPVGMAQRGDLVLVPGADGWDAAMAMVSPNGRQVVTARAGGVGWLWMPARAARRAWRIG